MIHRVGDESAQIVISVVAPCFNEESAVDAFIKETLAVLDAQAAPFEILLVDDGSTDLTFEVIRRWASVRSEVRGIQLSRNFGHQAALTAGLDRARGQAVITMDSDLQHPPALIPDLLGAWRAGAEVVLTRRLPNGRESAFKRVTSAAFYRALSRLSRIELEAGTSDFRLLDRRVVEAFRECRELHRLLRGLAVWVGFKKVVIPFQVQDRVSGVSKYTLTRMMRLALDGIFSFSTAPLRAAILVGIGSSGLAIAYLLVVLGVWWVRPDLVEPGWTSMIGAVLFIGGVQLTFLGVVGEYVGRIFQQVKDRPLYLVRQVAPLPAASPGNRLDAEVSYEMGPSQDGDGA
ncbi:MAG: glycosyltransferase family 2 protein [Planctomycetota bacterium]